MKPDDFLWLLPASALIAAMVVPIGAHFVGEAFWWLGYAWHQHSKALRVAYDAYQTMWKGGGG